jgi:hypothetical protein
MVYLKKIIEVVKKHKPNPKFIAFQTSPMAHDAMLAMVAEIDELKKALKACEYAGFFYDICNESHVDFCPLCHCFLNNDHYPDCILGIALGEEANDLKWRRVLYGKNERGIQ